jgi:RNA polymerase sigma-70 factor (ECF subfamily)
VIDGDGMPGSDDSDENLAARVKEGDGDAFAALIRRHERRLYNLAYRMLGRPQDAQDAVQEAFLSCYRRIGTFRGDAAFATWLHRIAVNACYDALRKRVPEPMDPAGLPERPSPDPAERAVAAADVERGLLTVPEEFRAPLILHDLLDVPVEEVADALGVPAGTVKSRLHRGRAHLGRALRGEPRTVAAPSKPPIP